MGFFNKKEKIKKVEEEKPEERSQTAESQIMGMFLPEDEVTANEAMAIPSFAACVDIISGVVAMLPIKLYREVNGQREEILDDHRTALLNRETGDLLTGFQAKKAWIMDYLLHGNGYMYIEKKLNEVTGLYYTEQMHVTAEKGANPIYKVAVLRVSGETYRTFEFLRLLRQTRDGVTGTGIVEQNAKAIAVTYNALVYENMLVKKGGNKRGFLKAQRRLEKEQLHALKDAFKMMYQNNDENVIVLNEGIDFKEASNTSVEMQLNQNKMTNAKEMCKIFNTPPTIIDGTAKDDEVSLWSKICLAPIIKDIETALDCGMLMESEKYPEDAKDGTLYFSVDTRELLRGDVLKRYQAYKMAVDSNLLQVDEARYLEDMPALGLNFVKLGLQDVLYDPKTKEVYTPNTNKVTTLGAAEGGETDAESGDQGKRSNS